MNEIQELQNMATRLLQMAGDERNDTDSRRNNPNALKRRAAYTIYDAVEEMMEAAAKDRNLTLVPGSVEVLRERRAA